MDTNMPKFHLMSELPARRPSCTELSEIFFKSGYEGPYYNLTQQNLETIITACCEQQKLHLPGCASVTDKLFVHLCPVNTVQQNLRSLNIYDTSVSAPMAVCVFYSLPNLETFVYHDISGFLHYAGINIVKPDRRRIFRKRITKLQLGMIHDADIQLKYSNCHTGNFSELKEVELYLPAGNTKKSQADIFQFRRNKNGFYQFADIDKVITAMNPAKIFGGNTGIQLTEMSLDSVRDIKLDKTFSTLQFLKKMLLRSCSTKISYLMEVSPHLVQPDMDYHISRSVETLGLCNMTKDDVVRIIRHCPNLKKVDLFYLELTNNVFYYLDKSVKVTMNNCHGCCILQILHRLNLEVSISIFKQLATVKEMNSFRQIIIFSVIILPICFLLYLLKLSLR